LIQLCAITFEFPPFFPISKYFWTRSGIESPGHGSFPNSVDWCWPFEDEKFAEALQHSRSRLDRWEWTYCQTGYTHVYCTCNCTLHGLWHLADHVVCHLAWMLGPVSQSSSRTSATRLGCQPIGHRPALATDKLARPMARSGSFQAAERGRRLDRRDASRVVRQQ
jgi:hypothetical protein